MYNATQHWPILQRFNTNFNDLANKVRSFMVIGEKGEGLIVATKNGQGYWMEKILFKAGRSITAIKPTQLNVPGLVQMAQGQNHILLLNERGEIYSMGENDWGQLGLGTVNQETLLSPKFISNPHQFTSVRCGNWHSLALTVDGEIWAWGKNYSGQVGIHKTSDIQPFPHQISELNPHRIVAVECGGHHSLSLTDQGEVYAWGMNDDGQLGDGKESYQRQSTHTATLIPTPSPVRSIAAGERHTLLLNESGEVYACGSNIYGQLGLPTTTKSSSRLSKVAGLPPISQIASHPATNLSIALSTNISNIARKECFVWGQMANGTPISTPCKLHSFYSTVDSPLTSFSTDRSTPHSVQLEKIYDDYSDTYDDRYEDYD